MLVVLAITAAAVPGVLWILEPPKIEPPFERLVDTEPGLIKEFSLKDATGKRHTAAEWANRPAIVFFVIARTCAVSAAYAPEIARIAAKYGARGVVFYGIDGDPDATAEAVAAHGAERGFPFPILLDPAQEIALQTGVTVTPEAVLLAPDGQVLYRGRIDDLYAPHGKRRPRPGAHDLESALEAVLADELPAATFRKPFGRPIPTASQGAHRAETITFNKHVAPILWKNCARCHRTGAVAPFPLLTYEDAAKRAEFIRDVSISGQMPPWKPRPGAGIFRDAARLSVLEKRILTLWAESDHPRGDPQDLPPPPRFNDGWQLGEPDLVLTMPEPFKIPAGGRDPYWAFSLPVDLGRDMVISGIEFRPGNRRVVHHSRIYHDESGDAGRRDRAHDGPGFPAWIGAPGSMELPYPSLGGWTPGMTARLAPAGVARTINRGSEIVLRIHYHATGKPEEDRSSVALFAAKSPPTRKMSGYVLCSPKIDIPAGERRHRIMISSRVKANVHLYAVVPHAHSLCREFRLSATMPDGTVKPLLWITDWDVGWQDQYQYLKPVRLPVGTLLTLAAYFDNTEGNPHNPHSPPRRVRWGPETDDEMCACHLEFMPDGPEGYEAYPVKSPFGL